MSARNGANSRSALLVLGVLWAGSAPAQVANMPKDVQERLAELGAVWGKDVNGNIAKTTELYTPILRDAPKTGVRPVRDLSYGPDPRQKLDIYQPEGKSGVPIVAFFHGGAYVSGERNLNGEIYANVPTYFARQGLLGVNATYRLAPAARWPSGAEDVGAVVKWLHANASRYGGDGRRIYLLGHSAGATHVSTYAFNKALQPADGPGVAGLVLMSGRYQVNPRPDDPNLQNVRAYFGDDPAQYPARSALAYAKDAGAIPTFLVITEYDNPDIDTQGALLLAALCARDRTCPRFTRLQGHNHRSMVYQFNTADDALGREILEFIRRGR